ncbi:MAG TPA: arsenate reductase ArsC [Gemmatimonadales bacterium]|nr:arsenate reductase ArsC [Gemmatimonadales bacterium]
MYRTLPEPAEPVRVLFLCTGNSARSQIGEALLRTRGGWRFVVASAGTRPAPAVHPLVLEALRDAGIQWDGHPPTHVDAIAGDGWDLIITVCDGALEACPMLPGAAQAHWSLPDPAAVQGDDRERRRAFRDTVAALERRVGGLVRLAARGLDRDALVRAARDMEHAAG